MTTDCQLCACVRERDEAVRDLGLCISGRAFAVRGFEAQYAFALRYKHALERIPAMARHPDAAKACVNIIAFVGQTMGEENP